MSHAPGSHLALFPLKNTLLNRWQGPLHLSYADPWEKGVTDVFKAAEELGLDVNPGQYNSHPTGHLYPSLKQPHNIR
jgi:hypothetical protein